MCDGIVIDAHMIPAIRYDLVQESGLLYELIQWLIQNCGIATTPQIEAHWKTKCSDNDPFFWTWYTERILDRSIRINEPNGLENEKIKKIHNEYGLPRDPFVIACISCAHATNSPRYILAEDMDFHDPKSKRLETRTQNKIRENRNGRLCRYLEKELNIRVGTKSDARSHFSIDIGACPNNVINSRNICPKLPCS